MKLTKQFKLQVKTQQGWKDAHWDFPKAEHPMVFEKKGEAIIARMRRFGIGARHFTRIVTPSGRKYLI